MYLESSLGISYVYRLSSGMIFFDSSVSTCMSMATSATPAPFSAASALSYVVTVCSQRSSQPLLPRMYTSPDFRAVCRIPFVIMTSGWSLNVLPHVAQ